ncbi:hypothetical protein [Methylobacterium aquaticum]|jgi:hypothetical protein|uniref:hypothetical protein n=1 Tax=Methylobacterium aquaticum TaxID=270351 RepID=UPI000B17A56A|nr:hypothetical protein [Methylobacterium aquaticum]
MKHRRYVSAADLVEEFGFTERHWTRMAAAGRVPGARQPFGPRSRWVFDLATLREWWVAAEKEGRPVWSPQPRPGRTPISRVKPPSDQPSGNDLKQLVAKVLANHPQNPIRKRAGPHS